MELRKCPVCGGKLRSEALGWICYDCQGFIDMQGVFHEHIEKPFMPPQTNADRIRAMSDEELAEIISKIAFDVYNCNEAQTQFVELLKTPPQCDGRCGNCVLNWLKQPAEV